jgi:amino acid transporter
VFGRVQPVHRIPHVALLAVGGMTLFWSFFDLQVVIDVLLAARILEQFITQIIGVMLLRVRQPDRPRPFRIWLYPLPCLVALVGWACLYWASGAGVIAGLLTLGVGLLLFLGWAARSRTWPFGTPAVRTGG